MADPVVEYDDRTALLVVDVQNDFADPKGSLSVQGGDEVVPVINAEVERAAASDALVVYTRDWHPPDTPHFAERGGRWPVHCVRDTWGAELHPDLVVAGMEVKKATGFEDGYSGFSVQHLDSGTVAPTELADVLRERGVERVVIAGLATDYCVRETGLDARRLGFDTTVLRAAVRAVEVEAGDGDRALDELAAAGVAIK